MKHRGEERQGNDLRSLLNQRIPPRPSYAMPAGAERPRNDGVLEITIEVSPRERENVSIDVARRFVAATPMRSRPDSMMSKTGRIVGNVIPRTRTVGLCRYSKI
jgi:hypothetical protein